MKDSRELSAECVKQLRKIQEAETGGNMAAFPTLIICLGRESISRVSAVRKILNDNWNNAGFLQYLGLELTEDGWKCENLTTNELFHDVEEAVRDTVVQLTSQSDKVFAERSRVKVEFILQAEEDNAFEYYELYENTKKVMNYVLLKTLFLMLDESTKEKESRARQLCSRIRKYRESELYHEDGTMYLLSNYLKGGFVLKGGRMEENYRLIADIILLGGNYRDGEWTRDSNIYNGVKTAAYSLVTKPIEDIALISLEKLAEKLLEQEKETVEKTESGKYANSVDGLFKKLEIGHSAIQIVEEMYVHSIRDKLPSPTVWEELPFFSDADYKAVQKNEKPDWNQADRVTGQVLSAFYGMYYEAAVHLCFESREKIEELEDAVYREWKTRLRLFECKKLFGSEEFAEKIRKITPVVAIDHKMSGTEALCHMAQERCKSSFYQEMIPLIERVARRLLVEADDTEKRYAGLLKDIKAQRIHGQEEAVTEHFYESEVEAFLQQSKRRDAGRIFALDSKEGDMLDALYGIYRELLEQRAAYRTSFEEELAFRMQQLGPAQRMLLVRKELNESIEKNGRLNCIANYSDSKAGSYYLVNTSADYYRELQKNVSMGEFRIFNLNRTDSIEKIEIYNINSFRGISLFDEI